MLSQHWLVMAALARSLRLVLQVHAKVSYLVVHVHKINREPVIEPILCAMRSDIACLCQAEPIQYTEYG